MNSPTDAGQYLLGKIEAVELLASLLAAQLSPAMASVVLSQCATLREKTNNGEVLSAQEDGFLSVEQTVLRALKQAADAEKMRSIDSSAQH